MHPRDLLRRSFPQASLELTFLSCPSYVTLLSHPDTLLIPETPVTFSLFTRHTVTFTRLIHPGLLLSQETV